MELAAKNPPTTTFTLLEYNPSVCTDTYPSLPTHVSLQQFNLLSDFANKGEWAGNFDLVNQRLLFFAWTEAEWMQVLKSYLTVLKPGGYIQLWELDLTSRLHWDMGKWHHVAADWGLALAAHRGIKPIESVLHLPSYLNQAGFEVVSDEAVDLDFTHRPTEPEPAPDPLAKWYKNTAYAICVKAHELGIMSEDKWRAFEEGIEEEWETNDRTKWALRARVLVARVSIFHFEEYTAYSPCLCRNPYRIRASMRY